MKFSVPQMLIIVALIASGVNFLVLKLHST